MLLVLTLAVLRVTVLCVTVLGLAVTTPTVTALGAALAVLVFAVRGVTTLAILRLRRGAPLRRSGVSAAGRAASGAAELSCLLAGGLRSRLGGEIRLVVVVVCTIRVVRVGHDSP